MNIYHVPLWLEVEADSPEEAFQAAIDWEHAVIGDDWDTEIDAVKHVLHGEVHQVERYIP